MHAADQVLRHADDHANSRHATIAQVGRVCGYTGLTQLPATSPHFRLTKGPAMARASRVLYFFLSKEQFIRLTGLAYVQTSPFYPQSNGKIKRWDKIVKMRVHPNTNTLVPGISPPIRDQLRQTLQHRASAQCHRLRDIGGQTRRAGRGDIRDAGSETRRRTRTAPPTERRCSGNRGQRKTTQTTDRLWDARAKSLNRYTKAHSPLGTGTTSPVHAEPIHTSIGSSGRFLKAPSSLV